MQEFGCQECNKEYRKLRKDGVSVFNVFAWFTGCAWNKIKQDFPVGAPDPIKSVSVPR